MAQRIARKALRLFWGHLEEGLAATSAEDVGFERALPALADYAVNLLPVQPDPELKPAIIELITSSIKKLNRKALSSIRNKHLVTSQKVAKEMGRKIGQRLGNQLSYLKEDPQKLDEVANKLIDFELENNTHQKIHPLVKELLYSSALKTIDHTVYPANNLNNT